MLQRTCASSDGDVGERATAAMAEVMEVVLLRVSARITKLAQFVRFEGQLMGLNEFLTSQNHMKSRGYRSHFKSHSEYSCIPMSSAERRPGPVGTRSAWNYPRTISKTRRLASSSSGW